MDQNEKLFPLRNKFPMDECKSILDLILVLPKKKIQIQNKTSLWIKGFFYFRSIFEICEAKKKKKKKQLN